MINREDAPEGVKAYKSDGAHGYSCWACHFNMGACPRRPTGTLWCTSDSRRDGVGVVFMTVEEHRTNKREQEKAQADL